MTSFTNIESRYVKRTQYEHIVKCPDMFIGNTEMDAEMHWIVNDDGYMTVDAIAFNHGLYKIFDEIIVNARDHTVRDTRCDEIRVDITPDGTISVWNNGGGIPVVIHSKYSVYLPELIFFHLLTSSNYNPNERRLVGGKNGLGAKLTNIFSSTFTITTVDSEHKKKYIQISKENPDDRLTKTLYQPTITSSNDKSFTSIEFRPLYRVAFGIGSDNLPDDLRKVFERRVFDLGATLEYVRVYLNGKLVPSGLSKYMKLFNHSDDNLVTYHDIESGWTIGACVRSNDSDSHSMISFVNGINTSHGGKHVKYIQDQISKALLLKLQKTREFKSITTIRPWILRSCYMIFVDAQIVNPVFNSQSKLCLETNQSMFGTVCKLPDKFINSLFHLISDMLRDRIASTLLVIPCVKKTSDISMEAIDGLQDAHDAGTRFSDKCSLILTEGKSAATFAIRGVTERGLSHRYGVFPLRGKVMNVQTNSSDKYEHNREINHIKRILGLVEGCKYSTPSQLGTLRYGHVILLTDADPDGSHIRGLLLNLFYFRWPSLVTNHGFIQYMRTPLMIGIRNGIERYLYSDIDEIESLVKDGWRFQYFKGLGSYENKHAIDLFSKLGSLLRTFKVTGKVCSDSLSMAFERDECDNRKTWIVNSMSKGKSEIDPDFDNDLRKLNQAACKVCIPGVICDMCMLCDECTPESKCSKCLECLKCKHAKICNECSTCHICKRRHKCKDCTDCKKCVSKKTCDKCSKCIECTRTRKPCRKLSVMIRCDKCRTKIDERRRNRKSKQREDTQQLTEQLTVGTNDGVLKCPQHIACTECIQNKVCMQCGGCELCKEAVSNFNDQLLMKLNRIAIARYDTEQLKKLDRSLRCDTCMKCTKCVGLHECIVCGDCDECRGNRKQYQRKNNETEYNRKRKLRCNTCVDCIECNIESTCNACIGCKVCNAKEKQYMDQVYKDKIAAIGISETTETGVSDDDVDDLNTYYEDCKDCLDCIELNKCKGCNECNRKKCKSCIKCTKCVLDLKCNKCTSCVKCKPKLCDVCVKCNKCTPSEKCMDCIQCTKCIKKCECCIYCKPGDKCEQCLLNQGSDYDITTVREFVDTDLVQFSIYNCSRSIPHIFDGLKTSQRKILYTMLIKPALLKRGSACKDNVKVSVLASTVSSETCYHHGETSLHDCIARMSHNFVGTNNINLLLPKGQLGSRWLGGKDAAQPRYTRVGISPITSKLFRSEDTPLYTKLTDDGTDVEFEYFMPIVPMVLINGCRGIGTGFSSMVLPHSLENVITSLKYIMNGGKDTVNLIPHFHGFVGTVTHDQRTRRYLTRGICNVIDERTVEITELPVGTWVSEYFDVLTTAKIAYKTEHGVCKPTKTKSQRMICGPMKELVIDFRNNSTPDKISFTLTVDPVKLNRLCKSGKLHDALKLQTSFSCDNMVLQSETGKLIHYKTVDHIMREFVKARIVLYEQRRVLLLSKIDSEKRIAHIKKDFISAVLDDTIRIQKVSKSEVMAQIKDVLKITDTPTLLILERMGIFSVTSTQYDELCSHVQQLEDRYSIISTTNVIDTWVSELNELYEYIYGKSSCK